jgi:hypothetical protein
MAVPRAYLEEHIQLLKTHLPGKVAELVFHLDKLGSADWEDRKARKVTMLPALQKTMCIIPSSSAHGITCLCFCVG